MTCAPHAKPIPGLGLDLIELDRIEQSWKRHGDRLLSRILTPKEKSVCLAHRNPIPFLAGRFCAKEALAKALGTGIGKHLGWHDLEILNDPQGKPLVYVSPQVNQYWNSPQLVLSITHSRDYASAVALWHH